VSTGGGMTRAAAGMSSDKTVIGDLKGIRKIERKESKEGSRYESNGPRRNGDEEDDRKSKPDEGKRRDEGEKRSGSSHRSRSNSRSRGRSNRRENGSRHRDKRRRDDSRDREEQGHKRR